MFLLISCLVFYRGFGSGYSCILGYGKGVLVHFLITTYWVYLVEWLFVYIIQGDSHYWVS